MTDAKFLRGFKYEFRKTEQLIYDWINRDNNTKFRAVSIGKQMQPTISKQINKCI